MGMFTNLEDIFKSVSDVANEAVSPVGSMISSILGSAPSGSGQLYSDLSNPKDKKKKNKLGISSLQIPMKNRQLASKGIKSTAGPASSGIQI